MNAAEILDGGRLIVFAVGAVILFTGLIKLAEVPLAVAFAVRSRRRDRTRAGRGLLPGRPTVSVVVPCYNEAAVIENCLRSIGASRYPVAEIIVVDDGSTDATAELANGFMPAIPGLEVVVQANAGKGAALNTGIARSHGEILLLVDADGVFRPDTIEELLRGFADDRVGAVCGDDRPVNVDRMLTMLLTVLSHVGTGLARRALSMMRCLPIVSGNIGAFRREVLEAVGPLRTDTLGEDLELTWRLYAHGYRAVFAPRALVYAESPSTVRGLWRQRVRWARGLLQTTAIHRTLVGNPRAGWFGPFLAVNTASMVVLPVLQLFVLTGLFALRLGGDDELPITALDWLGWLGLMVSVGLVLLALGLNRSWRDSRYLFTLPLWPLYSVFTSLTMVAALFREVRRAPARWDKLERTGVVTVAGARRAGPRHAATTRPGRAILGRERARERSA